MPLTGVAERVELVLITDKYLLASAAAVKEPMITVLLGMSVIFVGGSAGVMHGGNDVVVLLFCSGFNSR